MAESFRRKDDCFWATTGGGGAAQNAASVLQHEIREMYELQENHIRQTAAQAESLLAEERARFEEASCASQREGHQAGERLRRGGTWFRCAPISHWDSSETKHRPLRRSSTSDEKNAELEQRLQNYAQHVTLMQETAAQQISQVEQPHAAPDERLETAEVPSPR